jgi:hypothetical protein
MYHKLRISYLVGHSIFVLIFMVVFAICNTHLSVLYHDPRYWGKVHYLADYILDYSSAIRMYLTISACLAIYYNKCRRFYLYVLSSSLVVYYIVLYRFQDFQPW